MQSDKTLFLATGNPHKVQEARQILQKFDIKVRRLESPKIEIQSHDITKIAEFAAKQLSLRNPGAVAVEDSGLFVDSLEGFPGPYTSYAFQTIGAVGVLRLLKGSADRDASFKAAIAVSRSGHTLKTCLGEVKGRIAESIRGEKGFGFDPIFIPTGADRTFGEMSGSEKNLQSHRMKAFIEVAAWFCASNRHTHLLERAES